MIALEIWEPRWPAAKTCWPNWGREFCRHRHHQSARNRRHMGARTGKPIANAIVWQDRRTAEIAMAERSGHEAAITAKTGLLLDPYFSASKVGWLLDNVQGARRQSGSRRAGFGTIDSWLVWQLTEGRATSPMPAMRRAPACSIFTTINGTQNCSSCLACRQI